MKIRKGFVSNSSSSSFVCDICGHHEQVYSDDMSTSNNARCVNGHSFCRKHVVPRTVRQWLEFIRSEVSGDTDIPVLDWVEQVISGSTNQRDVQSYLQEFEDNYGLAVDCEVRVVSPSDEFERMLEMYDTFDQFDVERLPTDMCPICTLSRLTAKDKLKFAIKMAGFTNSAKFEHAILSTHDSYAALIDDVKDVTL